MSDAEIKNVWRCTTICVKKFRWFSSFGFYTGWHACFLWAFGRNVLLPLFKVKKKNVCPGIGHEAPNREYRYSSTLSFILALGGGGGWLMSWPSCFAPRMETQYLL
jgi:hypothetical protein